MVSSPTMSRALARIARTLTHHWKRSLLAAILTLVALGALAGTAGGPAADDFNVPGTESQQAIDLFRDHTPALAGADSTLVFTVADGKLTDTARKAAVQGALKQVAALPDVAEVGDPFAKGAQGLSSNGRLAAVDVRYDLEIQ